MIVLDLKNKKDWNMNGVNCESSVKMNNKGYFYSFIDKPGEYEFRILSKNISGNGLFYLRVVSEKDKILFNKKIKFTSKSWNESIFKISLKDFGKKAKVLITRELDGIGRIEIGRLTVKISEEVLPKESKRQKSIADNKLIRCESAVRAAVIIPYAIYGGAEVYLRNLFCHRPAGLEVDFLFLKPNKLSDYLKEYDCFNLGSLSKLKHQLIKENYDKIIYYNSKSVYSFILNLKQNNLICSDLIEIYHSNFKWSDSLSSLNSRSGISKIIRVADNLCNDISGDFSLKTIPVSIDVEKYKPKDSPIKELIGEGEGGMLFGMVARLSPEKNISYAIDLFKRLSNHRLIVIGDGPLRNSLKEKIVKEKIDNVKLIGYKENVYEYYNLLDVFLLTSKFEGTPISIIEAMSYNLPIFTTDVGEIRASLSYVEGIGYLTGELDEDAKMISDFKFDESINCREWVLKNNNSLINSSMFFGEIIGNSLTYSELDLSLPILSGAYF